jgi:hypothetical protein
VRDLVGIEHVGVGSDAGIESNDLGSATVLKNRVAKADPRYRVHGEHEIVMGMEGPNRMYELTAVLISRGGTDDQVRLVLGGNWARVLKEIWQGRAEINLLRIHIGHFALRSPAPVVPSFPRLLEQSREDYTGRRDHSMSSAILLSFS